MGYYINPPDMSKEDFLDKFGTKISPSDAAAAISAETLPVVLVNNGFFTAAGIAYDHRELAAFTSPEDVRPKRFYSVSREALKPYYK